MKRGAVLAAVVTISTVGGFVWLGWYSYNRVHADPLGQLIERSVMEAALHDAAGSGEPDDAPVVDDLLARGRKAALARPKGLVHPATKAEAGLIIARMGL